jgi:hypothetical protein
MRQSVFAKVAQASEIKTRFMDPRKRKPETHECMAHDRDDSRDQAPETNVEACNDLH